MSFTKYKAPRYLLLGLIFALVLIGCTQTNQTTASGTIRPTTPPSNAHPSVNPTLQVKIIDASGLPLQNIEVAITDSNHSVNANPMQIHNTNSKGELTFINTDPNTTYSIYVNDPKNIFYVTNAISNYNTTSMKPAYNETWGIDPWISANMSPLLIKMNEINNNLTAQILITNMNGEAIPGIEESLIDLNETNQETRSTNFNIKKQFDSNKGTTIDTEISNNTGETVFQNINRQKNYAVKFIDPQNSYYPTYIPNTYTGSDPATGWQYENTHTMITRDQHPATTIWLNLKDQYGKPLQGINASLQYANYVDEESYKSYLDSKQEYYNISNSTGDVIFKNVRPDLQYFIDFDKKLAPTGLLVISTNFYNHSLTLYPWAWNTMNESGANQPVH